MENIIPVEWGKRVWREVEEVCQRCLRLPQLVAAHARRESAAR